MNIGFFVIILHSMSGWKLAVSNASLNIFDQARVVRKGFTKKPNESKQNPIDKVPKTLPMNCGSSKPSGSSSKKLRDQ